MTASVALAQELRLRNGLMVSVRPVKRDDEAAIFEFLTDLSAESRRRRFGSAGTNLRTEAYRGAAGEDANHHGLLAMAHGRRVVGHAIYVRRSRPERAEIAVEVADDLHHLGLATLLVIGLAEFAEHRRITHFFAAVLPENQDMLAVLRHGFAAVPSDDSDAREVGLEFPTPSWRVAQARFGR